MSFSWARFCERAQELSGPGELRAQGQALRWRDFDLSIEVRGPVLRFDFGHACVLEIEEEEAEVLEASGLDFVAALALGSAYVVERAVGSARYREVWLGRGRTGLRLATGGAWLARLGRPRRLSCAEAEDVPPEPRHGASPPWENLGGFLGALAQEASEPQELPIDGELDLHTFKPKEVSKVVEAYLEEAQRRGLDRVRVIHGKGKGVQRRIVHALCDRHSAVLDYRLGGQGEGSWGATMVFLRPLGGTGEPGENDASA